MSTSTGSMPPETTIIEPIEQIYPTFVRHLYENNLIKACPAYLKQANITNAERVLFVKEHMEEFGLFTNLVQPEKNNDFSTRNRESGNLAFKNKNYNDALELYNASIAYAEISGSTDCLAFGYGNRSAVLFELGYFKHCLEDIDRTLTYDYPSTKKEKLLIRQSNANLLKDKSQPTYKFYKDLTETIENRNDVIKCASNKIKVEYNSTMGRHVVACDKISPGEIISIEKPYISVVLRTANYKNCAYCAYFPLNPIPCDRCPFVLFCNDKCKQLGYELFHRYECQMLSTIYMLNLPNMSLLALRVALVAKNEYRNVFEMNETDPAVAGFVPDEKDSNKLILDTNYTGIHYLITNTDKFPLNELMHKTVIASILLNLLKQTDFFDDFNDDYHSMFEVAAELLLRHLQTAPSNFHQVTATKVTGPETTQCVSFVEVAFSFLSLLNHSCAPNVFRSSHGTTTILRGLRPINPGDQLFDNYGYHHAMLTRVQRHVTLKEQYFFDCQCEACIDDWPTWSELQKQQRNLPHVKFLEKLTPLILQRNTTEPKKYFPKMKKVFGELEDYAPCSELCELQESFKEIYYLDGNIYDILKPQ